MVTFYTTVTDNYAPINFQTYNPSDCKFVCFSDKKIDVPNNWKNIVLPKGNLSSQELSRYTKINSHEYFGKDEFTVHFDCYRTINFNIVNKIISYMVDRKINLVTRRHPTRYTFSDELAFYFMDNFINLDQAEKIVKNLKNENYNFLNFKNTLNGFIIRKLDDDLIKYEKQWWEMFLSTEMNVKRDQLSMGICFSDYEKMGLIEREVEVFDSKITKNKDSGDVFNSMCSIEELVKFQNFLLSEVNVPFLGELHARNPERLSNSDLSKLIPYHH